MPPETLWCERPLARARTCPFLPLLNKSLLFCYPCVNPSLNLSLFPMRRGFVWGHIFLFFLLPLNSLFNMFFEEINEHGVKMRQVRLLFCIRECVGVSLKNFDVRETPVYRIVTDPVLLLPFDNSTSFRYCVSRFEPFPVRSDSRPFKKIKSTQHRALYFRKLQFYNRIRETNRNSWYFYENRLCCTNNVVCGMSWSTKIFSYIRESNIHVRYSYGVIESYIDHPNLNGPF